MAESKSAMLMRRATYALLALLIGVTGFFLRDAYATIKLDIANVYRTDAVEDSRITALESKLEAMDKTLTSTHDNVDAIYHFLIDGKIKDFKDAH